MKSILTFLLAVALVFGVYASAPITSAQSEYVILSSYYLLPGQSFTVSGFMFAPDETVTVSLADQQVSATANSAGEFTSPSITVPVSLINSSQNVTVAGNMGNSASVQLSVGTFYPNVVPSSYFVLPGGPVSFQGSGFLPNEGINVTLNGNIVTSTTADASGNFMTAQINTPFAPTNKTYHIAGDVTGISRDVVVSVSSSQAYIILGSYYLPANSSVNVTGRQFGYQEDIVVRVDGMETGRTKTDSNGEFSLNVQLPNSIGQHEVTAHGEMSGMTASSGLWAH